MSKKKKICLAVLFIILFVCTIPWGVCGAFLFIAMLFLVSAFTKPVGTFTYDDEERFERLNAFEWGKQCYNSKKFNEALQHFDVAVGVGLKKADLFALRGGCLQALKEISMQSTTSPKQLR